MQPGGEITLFSGGKDAGEFVATITHMGRSDVGVLVGAHCAVEREPLNQIHLAISIPAKALRQLHTAVYCSRFDLKRKR